METTWMSHRTAKQSSTRYRLEFARRGRRAAGEGHLGLRVAIDLEHVAAGGRRRGGDGRRGDDDIVPRLNGHGGALYVAAI